jgi:hypothetical protein
MANFSTTDLYLAAYLRRHAEAMDCRRVGGKVMFHLAFADEDINGNEFTPEGLHRNYFEDEDLQDFIENLKELRGKVHNLMKA